MLIQYGSGKNDTIKITGENTYVNKIQSNGGDDTITVEKGATASNINTGSGNDIITVTGEGTKVDKYTLDTEIMTY